MAAGARAANDVRDALGGLVVSLSPPEKRKLAPLASTEPPPPSAFKGVPLRKRVS